MKIIMMWFLAICCLTLKAQTTRNDGTIDFCFRKFEIPADCSKTGNFEVKRKDFEFSWVYVSDDNLLFASNGLLKKLETYKDFNKQKISCFILNKKVNGYKVSFKRGNETVYQIIAYGIIHDQPVMVQLGLKREPITNADIPDFAFQFVHLNNM